jgi:membrane-bound ClpP family serine protease
MTALGVILLVVGAVVAVAEVHYPSHGIIGGLGVVAMALGAVLAISGIGGGVVVGVLAGLALAGVGVGVLGLTVKHGAAVRRRRIRTGAEGLIGHVGVVRSWTDASGSVSLDGALWRARQSMSDEPPPQLHEGDAVVVEHLSGLTLSVRRAEDWELM